LFNQRQHKSFNYKSRFSKENSLDTDADSSEKPDFVLKWKGQRTANTKVKGVLPMRTLLLILVLLLICMYILDSKFN
jgi:type VI protein secretion system component VasF